MFGPDAATWLNGIITCDVLKVRAGRGTWGSLLSKQGKLSADLQIVGQSEELYLGVSGGDRGEILATLDRYLVMEDAEIELSDRRWLVYSGERPAIPGISGELPWGINGLAAVCAESHDLDSIRANLNAITQTSDEWRRWCTSNGFPVMGVDYSGTDNPHAASLERRTVDWSKGCYLGQEVVCMQDMRGKVKRRLVGLKWKSAGGLLSGAEVTNANGDEVGKVTSSSEGRAIASVQSSDYKPGTQLRVSGQTVVVFSLTE